MPCNVLKWTFMKFFKDCLWTLVAFTLIFSSVLLPDHFQSNVFVFFEPINTDLEVIQA